MYYSGLRNLIILLITLQSVIAIADVNPTNQVRGIDNNLGYQISLLDKTNASYANNASDQNSNFTNKADCCFDSCNCNCCSFFTFTTVNLNTSFNGAGQLIVVYQLPLVESPFSVFLRPPKS